MYIFNNLPGANGHSLTDREELWLAAMFSFLMDNYEEEGGSYDDAEQLIGEPVIMAEVSEALQKHIALYKDYRPNTWYTGPIPPQALTPPNKHIRLLVEFDCKLNSNTDGQYYRLMCPSDEGTWYYVEETGHIVEMHLAHANLKRWMLTHE